MGGIIENNQKIVRDNKAGNNICFVKRGGWTSPEIAYKGLLVSRKDVEAYLNDQCGDTPSFKDWKAAVEELFEDYKLFGLMEDLDEFKASDAMCVFVLDK